MTIIVIVILWLWMCDMARDLAIDIADIKAKLNKIIETQEPKK